MLLLNRTLIKLSKGLWGWILAIVCCKMLVLVATARLAGTISAFLGGMLNPAVTLADAGSAIFSAFIISLVLLLLDLLHGELEYRTTAKARLSLRRTIFSKVMELDAGRIEEIGPSKAITASVDGVESMQNYYSQYMPGLIYSLLAPIYLFLRFRRISLPLAVFLMAVSISIIPLNNIFRRYIENLRGKYWGSLEGLTEYYLESMRGLVTFKLFERDQDRSGNLKEKALIFTGSILEFMKVNFSSFLFTESIMYGTIFITVLVTGRCLINGSMELSNALLILMLSYSFFNSLKDLMNATHGALAGVAAAGRVEEIMAMDTRRPYNPQLPLKEDSPEGIELCGVTHIYDDAPVLKEISALPEGAALGDSGQKKAGCGDTAVNRPAVKNVSLTCKKGSVTALAGPSGCGKSTLAGLMMRFYDPSEGSIYLNGRNYESFTPGELRTHLVMVPQSVTIFSGSLRENLQLAREGVTDEELWEALKEVKLSDWAQDLPEGLDYYVGDAGSRLSGGQKQKIGIARALLGEAEYIILDEATSSIDRESEEEIWACIEGLKLKRTLVIISHRLSTIRNAGKIYVLDRGMLMEEGGHEELMTLNGLYAGLVREQERLEANILKGRGEEA